MSSQPKKRTRLLARRLLLLALAFYAVMLTVVSIANTVGPERWWPSALNLYFPQWLWAVPGVVLFLWALVTARRWAWAPLLAIAWVGGPLMGLVWTTAPQTSLGTHLRMITYNVKYGRRGISDIAKQINDSHPDLVFFQDADGALPGKMGEALSGWNVRAFGQYIIASRLPLSPLHVGSISFRDANHTYIECKMHLGSTEVTLMDVHLLTPRFGILAVRYFGADGIDQFKGECDDRIHQAEELGRDITRVKGPLIVAGDFNASLPTVVCRTMEKVGMQDAFAEAGRGYGYTYGHDLRFGHSYMRIDHIFVNHAWSVRSCEAGNAEGSDHRPVIADLMLK